MRSWHTKDGDIMSEMSLSMREPSVAPREADTVGSLKVCRGGTVVGETREEGGSYIFLCFAFGANSKKENPTKRGVFPCRHREDKKKCRL